MKIFRILLAWWYVLISRNNEVSKKRLVICSHCEKRKWFVCGECGCPLIAKSRLEDEECPHPDGDKWKGTSWEPIKLRIVIWPKELSCTNKKPDV